MLAWALAQGDDITAYAGLDSQDIGNVALNWGNANDGATSTVTAGGFGPGFFNLAANIGGNADIGGNNTEPQDVDISAGEGVANAAINIGGNRNRLHAGDGFLNIATTVGNLWVYPNGSDNDVTASGNMTLAFNVQPPFITEDCPGTCGNTVTADANLALAGAVGLVNRTVEQLRPGIEISAPFFNAPEDTATVLASNSTQKVRPSVKFSPGSNNNALRASRAKVDAALKSVDDQVKASVKTLNDRVTKSANKVNDTVRQATAKLAGGAKAGAADKAGGDA
jgi:hypothetical protein